MDNRPVVYVVDTDYSSIKIAVENIFQRFPLDVKNKLVWVKPNMMGNFAPNKHITTHPSLVSAVVEKLSSLEAKVVVGDNSGLQCMFSEDRIAQETGFWEASGGAFRVISKEVVRVALGQGIREEVSVSKIVRDCDIMISLPKMKTHLQTFITGAVKNSFGMVVGIQKPNLHLKYPGLDDFAGVVAQVYNIRRPDLIIMDAVKAMEGDGPNSPQLRDVNRLIASTDGVALDHYMAKIMGMEPQKIPLLKYCVKNRIGSDDYIVEGDSREIKNFILPKTYLMPQAKNYTLLQKILYHYILNKKIRIRKNKCKKCQLCFKICPAGAMQFDEYPQVSHNKCILCYCCKEVCQYNAITFSHTYIMAQKLMTVLEKIRNR